MNFASDNIMGASAPVLEALVRANEGPLPAYAADEITGRVEKRFCEIFEREVSVFLVATGTGANALALAAIVPPYGLAVCHREAHVIDDECGAPEFYMHGAKMAGLPGEGAKIAPATLTGFDPRSPPRPRQQAQHLPDFDQTKKSAAARRFFLRWGDWGSQPEGGCSIRDVGTWSVLSGHSIRKEQP
jgi:hypothetical protein